MPIFKYIAEDSRGKIKRVKVVFLSDNEVVLKLRKKDLNVTSLSNITGTRFSNIMVLFIITLRLFLSFSAMATFRPVQKYFSSVFMRFQAFPCFSC